MFAQMTTRTRNHEFDSELHSGDVGYRPPGESRETRTLKECDRVDPDNLEFVVSLLDRRFLTGDPMIYKKTRSDLLPALLLREWDVIVQKLGEMARARPLEIREYHLSSRTKYQGNVQAVCVTSTFCAMAWH